MKHSPCKQCELRTYMCHSTCAAYLEFAEHREKTRKSKQGESEMIEYRRICYNRNQRRMRNRFRGTGRYE